MDRAACGCEHRNRRQSGRYLASGSDALRDGSCSAGRRAAGRRQSQGRYAPAGPDRLVGRAPTGRGSVRGCNDCVAGRLSCLGHCVPAATCWRAPCLTCPARLASDGGYIPLHNGICDGTEKYPSCSTCQESEVEGSFSSRKRSNTLLCGNGGTRCGQCMVVGDIVAADALAEGKY